MAQTIKNLPAVRETWVRSLGWEDPLEEGTVNPLQYSCLENPHGQRSLAGHGQRSLAGYSPWGRKESDTTERVSLTQTIQKEKKKYHLENKIIRVSFLRETSCLGG